MVYSIQSSTKVDNLLYYRCGSSSSGYTNVFEVCDIQLHLQMFDAQLLDSGAHKEGGFLAVF